MTPSNTAIVTAQMLIRRPAAEVFNAFIDPAVTTNFWFTKSTGKLETGKTITWTWEMYGVSINVQVKEIVPGQKIVVDWNDPVTTIEFNFQDRGDGTTYLVINNYGFKQEGLELAKAINDNTGGFTTVVDGLKAWLEHGIKLNLIGDKFSKGH
ncbi:MAG: SRPBCC family protein [Filimonas sp.]|nr:SRPBCC family protein [Filimonas sp.]